MAVLFISDLHLEDGRPDGLEWLLDLLSGPARQADALYVLGDLFEYWIGDDALSACATRLAPEMAAVAAAGTVCHFLHGNRDFLLGPHYAGLAGLRLLPETCVIDLYGTPTLLLHGDTLCTDDVAYQQVRRQLRDPDWQAAVLQKPIDERLRLAGEARDASREHTGSASMEIMDVNPHAVVEAFRQHDVDRMIHGHTHRPGVHRHELGDGREGQRIVLADWYRAGSYLEVTPEGFRSVEL